MKGTNADQFAKNNAWLAANGIVDNPPLRLKYVAVPSPKFGGKKRGQSNSGGVGRAARRRKRKGARS